MVKGRIKAGEGTLVGNAGEHYVMAELLKRGVIAALASRNAPAFDILATKGNIDVRLRVKTKSEDYDIWQWNTHKDGTIFRLLNNERDFTVLVNLAMKSENLRFYIVPSIQLDKCLKADHAAWLAKRGKKGQKHSEANRKRHLNEKKHADVIASKLDAWDDLWK
ncbi:MAG TPA: hypothetical protein PKV72_04025 [Candidatus Peribacteria bacterium]|nr:hypothetical protein [Candidatus Peribacteria bacterium]